MKYQATKNMKAVLEEIGYTKKVIDCELCGYKDLGKYDIEISGMNNNRKKINYVIYLWERSPLVRIVEQITVKSIEELKAAIEYLELTYK